MTGVLTTLLGAGGDTEVKISCYSDEWVTYPKLRAAQDHSTAKAEEAGTDSPQPHQSQPCLTSI